MKHWLVLGVLLAGGIARAQDVPPERLYPLAEGDLWQYRALLRSCIGMSCSEYLRFIFREVTGDTTVDGVRWAVLHEEIVYDGVPTLTGDYGARVVADSTGGRIERLYLGCANCALDVDAPLPDSTSPDVVNIGGIDYPVPSLGEAVHFEDSGPNHYSHTSRYAADIGQVFHFKTWGGTGGLSGSQRAELEYAIVSGVTYGQHPVAVEDRNSGPVRTGTVWPNPVRSVAIVRLDRPLETPDVVEVLDVLGRRIALTSNLRWVNDSTLSIDASDWSPGLYFVRLVGSSGSAVARFTRVN
jgi:hypothetical protein